MREISMLKNRLWNPTRAIEVTDARKRQFLLAGAGFAALTGWVTQGTSALAGQQDETEITQPASASNSTFIHRAFEMRQKAIDLGDQAFGAIVVRHNIIIGQSWSRVILDQDPTGHAEMTAIRDAAKRLNSRDLTDAVLYSSSHPCPMCEAGAYWAGINKMIHGQDAADAGSPQLCRSA
jgi:tRNA(Arg) A34 adenosine deaminase TadA